MNKPPQPLTPLDSECPPPPPFVLTELLERCMGNAAIATLLLDKFEQQLSADVRAIQERLAVRDAEQIGRTAHALKGAAGALAAATLRDLAAEIETLSRANQLDSIAQEFTSLRSEVERCVAYLPAARAALASNTAGTSNDPGAP